MMKKLWLCLMLSALTPTVVTRVGRAEDAVQPPLSVSLTGEAAEAYKSAVLVFQDGDRAGALQKFKRAYELSRDPRLLWNMAACEKELRHYARAAALVDQYLSDGADRLTSDDRTAATQTQTALRDYYSAVTLEGLPPGAKVSIDAEVSGTAPLSQPITLDLGRHEIRVEAPGYQPDARVLDVPGASPVKVHITMTAEIPRAHLTVYGSEDRDLIRIDGKVVGSSRWEGALTPGTHTIRVTADGKKPYETRIVLAAFSNRNIGVVLENEEHSARIWPWIVSGAVVAGGAVLGGYFLLKPKDEAGSSPSGMLSTVHLPSNDPAQ